mgnify:CR=1 FL=1
MFGQCFHKSPLSNLILTTYYRRNGGDSVPYLSTKVVKTPELINTVYTYFSMSTPNLNSRKTNFNQFVVTFGLRFRISLALAGLVGWLP